MKKEKRKKNKEAANGTVISKFCIKDVTTRDAKIIKKGKG